MDHFLHGFEIESVVPMPDDCYIIKTSDFYCLAKAGGLWERR